ncbi:helix-turn-helix domain-containing protein [Nocardioides sp. AE5]|uniref:TetR/AcrR family transcriptional regulator n=1 Tax=Nocardioides sp. AE5 TaxID=2962573 RepID=UPI0028828A1A|nr:helix-turn-helix domain-containing protein [Nocardioides sp. AE5]MDT0200827.1 helix-turn-helix domain-containing protein [Nocardioides sp. AE5]
MTPADRRQAILDAVVPLVIEHGGDVSTRLIAEAAGIAEGTIFRAFADKTELMLAVAEEAIHPAHGREEFEAMLAATDDLRERVRLASQALTVQMQRAMMVMFAVRGYLLKQGRPATGDEDPPDFLVRANRELLAMLTDLFAPYADRLRVPPATAAAVLRSLVFGSRHPGMETETDLSADQIADIIVGGVMLGDHADLKAGDA